MSEPSIDRLLQRKDESLARLRQERDTLSQQVERLKVEALNRKHYSDSPRSTLHSWNESESLQEVGGRCGLCEAVRDTLNQLADAPHTASPDSHTQEEEG